MFSSLRNLFSYLTLDDFSYNEEFVDEINDKSVDERIRKGTITFIASNSAEIDNAYVFALKTDYLKVGDKVKYKVFNHFGNIEISDVILDVVSQTTQGVIKSLNDDLYTFEPGNVQFYLCSVKVNFIPSQGDYVKLIIENGKLVSVSATNDRILTGIITSYDNITERGLIDNKVTFSHKDCSDFTPKKNIQVTCRALNNEFGERAIEINEVKRKYKLDVPYIPFFTVKFGDRKEVVIKVTNFSQKNVEIISCKFTSQNSKLIVSPRLKNIEPGQYVTYVLLCHGNKIGKNEAMLEWMFDNVKIVRKIKYNTVNFSNQKTIVIPSEKKLLVPNYVNVKMREYALSNDILKISCNNVDQAINDLCDLHPCLKENLNKHNYANKMHCLLFIEEAEQVLNAKTLTNKFPLYLVRNNMYYFEYNTDSVYSTLFVGDMVIVSYAWKSDKQYSGKIYDTNSNQIFIKLSPLFINDYHTNASYTLEFIRSRTPMRKTHFAVDIVRKNNLLHRVFPEKPKSETKLNNTIQWVNRSLNDEQKSAVKNILSKNSSQPYIIWGPPGTGKTVTVVELILQLSQMKDTRIMVVAPTNSAIDLIGIKLFEAGLTKKNMVRLCSYGAYIQGNIPTCLIGMTYTPSLFDEPPNSDDKVPVIPQNCIGKHQVTLGTMQCIGTLCSIGLPGGYFTHIIVDEAGQATEPELLIPMSFLDAEYSQFVLAGDPNQLGPIVTSQVAGKLGLKESFLSRIMTLNPYKRDSNKYDCLGYDKRVATKLIRNYRALPQLVKMTSDVFYDGDLVANITEDSTEFNLLKKIKINSTPLNNSLMCINIEGPELQSKDSYSFYNNHEIMRILMILSELYTVMTPEQIGIITPYKLQSKMLNQRIESLNMFAPKIGSVEEFQGTERDVIIFSTVRSSKNLSRGLPDFIKEKNKINVALSRAKVLNLIVGNKAYLQTDPLWNSILNYFN